MPFRETTKMSEREEMVEKYESGLYTVSELAKQYGVSRPTVYLWIGRSEAAEALVDRPPIAKSCPHATDEAVVEKLLKAKHAKPQWGPAKQRARLMKAYPNEVWPAVSTIGEIYDAHGLVKKRRKRRSRVPIRRVEQVQPTGPGEMMSCDHKGWFRLSNGRYCYPLTINEPFSRYIYAIDALSSTSLEEAKPVFIRVFREYGIPSAMLSDNGGPFCCSRALGGLTRLSVSWIKQGILPTRIRKGCPWENGIHERMHKTLKAETARPPQENQRQQQKRFDEFRREFNHERPHEAHGGQAPASLFARCPREYSEARAKADVEYPGHFEPRRVGNRGEIKWKGQVLFVSESLVGEQVGLEETDDGVWTLHFADVELGRYDARTRSLS
jgi:transposase InsO family protein